MMYYPGRQAPCIEYVKLFSKGMSGLTETTYAKFIPCKKNYCGHLIAEPDFTFILTKHGVF